MQVRNQRKKAFPLILESFRNFQSKLLAKLEAPLVNIGLKQSQKQLLKGCLFSGFTPLCETYAKKASEESCGTDKLTTTLNNYLGKIVEGR